MKVSDIALHIFQIGSPVLIATLTWLATKLAQLTNAPAGKLARVVQAYADKSAA